MYPPVRRAACYFAGPTRKFASVIEDHVHRLHRQTDFDSCTAALNPPKLSSFLEAWMFSGSRAINQTAV